MANTATGRAFSAKALLAAFAITALGGVAVAAVKLPAVLSSPRTNASVAAPGHLAPAPSGPGTDPAPGGSASGPARSHPGESRTVPPGTLSGSSGSGQAKPSAGPGRSESPDTPGRPDGTATPGSDPNAALVALCHSFQQQQGGGDGDGGKEKQLLAAPALAPLVKAAKGAEHVDSYCTTLVGKAKEHGGPATPSAPGEPAPEPPKGGDSKTPKDEQPVPPAQLGLALTPAPSAPPLPLQAPLAALLDGVLVG